MKPNFNLQKWLALTQQEETKAQPPSMADSTTVEMDIERVVQAIEMAHCDITTDYSNWVQVGFAFANELGEMGRDYFHRVSRYYSKYSFEDTNKKYDQFLKGTRNTVTIKSFFFLAKQAGIEIAPEKAVPSAEKKTPVKKNEAEEVEDEKVLFNTPKLPYSVYENLPKLLDQSTKLFAEGIEQDVFFMSALTVLSGCLPNLEGAYFNRFLSPHLYLFITGPAASGKGTMVWARYFGDAIEEDFEKETNVLLEAYQQQLYDYEGLPKAQKLGFPKPMEPPRKMFYIPANTSSSALTQLLAENNYKGVIFETEADTMSSTAKQDWGDSSDIFRKAFHHENTSMARRKDREIVRIKDPHLAMCLSGTPKQVHNLMPEVENGLFSRFMYYAFQDNRAFLNPFVSYRDSNYNQFFLKKSYEVFHLFDKLRKLPQSIIFSVTKAQGEKFTEYFQILLEKNKMLLARDLDANTKRLGVIMFRIAMILSGLRLMDLPIGTPYPEKIICSDQDFQTALTIATTLESHAVAVYQHMPKVNLKGARLIFYENLPEKFTRQQYQEIATTLGIQPRTADKYIQFLSPKLLDHNYNEYFKKNNGRVAHSSQASQASQDPNIF